MGRALCNWTPAFLWTLCRRIPLAVPMQSPAGPPAATPRDETMGFMAVTSEGLSPTGSP